MRCHNQRLASCKPSLRRNKGLSCVPTSGSHAVPEDRGRVAAGSPRPCCMGTGKLAPARSSPWPGAQSKAALSPFEAGEINVQLVGLLPRHDRRLPPARCRRGSLGRHGQQLGRRSGTCDDSARHPTSGRHTSTAERCRGARRGNGLSYVPTCPSAAERCREARRASDLCCVPTREQSPRCSVPRDAGKGEHLRAHVACPRSDEPSRSRDASTLRSRLARSEQCRCA